MYSDIGRLTNKPEIRTTPSGKAVCNFTIAVDDLPDKDGNRRSNFIDCVVWGKLAEMLAKNFIKGERIFVVGDLKTRSYEDKEGKKHKIIEVLVERIKFCESKSSKANRAQSAPDVPEAAANDIPSYGIPDEPTFEDVPDGDDLPF